MSKSLEDKEISILFVDNERIRELNRTYRGIDKPTDVLSFSQSDERCPAQISPQPMGDVVISLEKARENMESYESTFWEEIARLLIHGTLHLLGYDHEDNEERKVMEGEEQKITEFVWKGDKIKNIWGL